jgi:hypothetical protein
MQKRTVRIPTGAGFIEIELDSVTEIAELVQALKPQTPTNEPQPTPQAKTIQRTSPTTRRPVGRPKSRLTGPTYKLDYSKARVAKDFALIALRDLVEKNGPKRGYKPGEIFEHMVRTGGIIDSTAKLPKQTVRVALGRNPAVFRNVKNFWFLTSPVQVGQEKLTEESKLLFPETSEAPV